MRSIVIATHGTLASALLATAEMIIGPAPRARAVNFDVGASVEDLTRRVEDAVDEVGGDEPVLVLVDLAGGSPSRVAATLAYKNRATVLTGANLPMVIAALTETGANLDAVVAEAGRTGIDSYHTAPVKGGGLK